MSINEAVADALTDYAVAWRDSEGVACIKIATELSAAIEQHVAEAVKAEREVCLNACDSARLSQNSRFGFDGLFVEVANTAIDACMEAIRARADHEPNRLPSHRCSSLCSPDETFCAITKDGKCDAIDRSCAAVIRARAEKEAK